MSEEPRNQFGQARHGGCVDVCSYISLGLMNSSCLKMMTKRKSVLRSRKQKDC